MSPSRRGAENRVGHGVADDVGVRVARAAPRSNGIVDAAENERAALDEPMQVVPDARARPVRAGRSRVPRAIASAIGRSSGVVILMLVASPSTSRTAWPARSASAASSVASTPSLAERQRVAQHVAPERLRRLREKDRLARQRLARRRRSASPPPASPCRAPARAASAAPRLGGRRNRPRDRDPALTNGRAAS